MPTLRAASRSQRGRLDMRLDEEQKALLERAAELSGQTLTAFVLDSARRAAEQTVRHHSLIALSARDAEAFVEALLNPPPPAPRLARSLRRQRRLPTQ
ncbi:MAG TPA: DUF1778 domain-containing protein [Dehalococcoidia bacterium]|nr:DUF1778 domain-containing protein [Dehalococcoidia bacterium]